ncbi:MAG: hypothetical protein MJ082_03360 [Clostridia bacterium]|nr:hypothetical protein [Clostridia bacterium]
MSKYQALWDYVSGTGKDVLTLTFADIEAIACPIDHSFLNFKKELLSFGFEVGKISMKNQTVEFRRIV